MWEVSMADSQKQWNPEDPDKLHATATGPAPRVGKHWIFAGIVIIIMAVAAIVFN